MASMQADVLGSGLTVIYGKKLSLGVWSKKGIRPAHEETYYNMKKQTKCPSLKIHDYWLGGHTLQHFSTSVTFSSVNYNCKCGPLLS